MGFFNRDSDRVEIDTDRRKILERPWIQLPSPAVPSEKPKTEPKTEPKPEPPRRTWRRREPTPAPTPRRRHEPTPNDDYQEMLLTEEACGGVCTPFRVTLTGSQPRPRRRGGVSNGGQNYDPDVWRESSLIVRFVQGLTDFLFGADFD